MIFETDSWVPICGHFFWDDQIGANKFCQKLGYNSGNVSKIGSESYSVDAFKIGKCGKNDTLLECGEGCNDYDNSGRCNDDRNLDCSAGQPVKIKISCEGNSSEISSCKGRLNLYSKEFFLAFIKVIFLHILSLCFHFGNRCLFFSHL